MNKTKGLLGSMFNKEWIVILKYNKTTNNRMINVKLNGKPGIFLALFLYF